MAGPLSYLPVLAAGFGLGPVFFGGLWLTVRAQSKSRHPVLLAVGSFLGRTALVLAGLTLAMDRRWQKAVACLVGFALARLVLAKWIPAPRTAGKDVG